MYVNFSGVIWEHTKTNKYIWGIAWVEENVEDFGTDT